MIAAGRSAPCVVIVPIPEIEIVCVFSVLYVSRVDG